MPIDGNIFIENDHRAKIAGLQDQDDNVYSSGAVELTLYESDGSTKVTGQTWPLTLSAVSGEAGSYQATVEDTIDVTEGEVYVAKVVIDAGGMDAAVWKSLLCKKRYV